LRLREEKKKDRKEAGPEAMKSYLIAILKLRKPMSWKSYQTAYL